MQDKYWDMIDLFIERERLRFYHSIDMYKREILEDFFEYQEGDRGKDWNLSKLRKKDRGTYSQHLTGIHGIRKNAYTTNRMLVIDDFIEFALVMGWIERNRWLVS